MSEFELRPLSNHEPDETVLLQEFMRSKYRTLKMLYLCEWLCQGFCALASRFVIVCADSWNAALDMLTTDCLPLINFLFLSSFTL